MENCDGCVALGSMGLKIDKVQSEVERLENKIQDVVIENDATSNNLGKGMTMLEQKFDALEKSVNEKIDAMPAMLEEIINKFLASLMKKILLGAFILVIAVVIGYAKPFLESALKTLLEKVVG